MKNSKSEDSDGFDFDDDEDEDDITESNATGSQFESSVSQSAQKTKTFEGGSGLMGANKPFNIDEIIKTLLTNKVRNIGLTGEISE